MGCPWCGCPYAAATSCPECGQPLPSPLEVTGPLEDPAAGADAGTPISDVVPPPKGIRTGTVLDVLCEGGGLPIGANVLLAGNAGVGKSTLALLAAAGWARPGRVAAYWSFEEHRSRIVQRAARVGAVGDVRVFTEWPARRLRGGQALYVVDSAQWANLPAVMAPLESDARAVQVAKYLSGLMGAGEFTSVLLLSHATKDGDVAGSAALQHAVDVVCVLDRGADAYALHVRKNRFGSCGEFPVTWPCPMA